MQAFLKTGKLGSVSEKPSTSSEGGKTPSRKGPPPPWVEKYRPRTVDDIVEQTEVVSVLKECLDGGDIPHLLFYGPPGTGKTSSILAAARQLFGDITKDRVLELNASDERGIQVVRDKVKSFSQLTASSTRPDGRPCPPFKLVILDEADSMTKDAQAALRRTMEKETRSTRFCLVCNYVSRIIPPITSRCSKFRFKPLAQDKVIERLKFICERENLEYEDDSLEFVVKNCTGDLRKSITCLQSCARLSGKVNKKSVIEVSGVVPSELVDKYMSVKAYGELEAFVDEFMLEAYSTSQLLEQLSEVVVDSPRYNLVQKATICEKIAVCSYRILDGGSDLMQMMDLGCTLILANNNKSLKSCID